MPTVKPLLPLAALILVAACDMPPSGAPYSRAPIAAPAPPPAPVETRPGPAITVPGYQPDPMPNEPARVTTPGDTCGASSLQGFVGSVAPSPFPASGPVRVYAEGDPVTMDHNPSRVNVVVDGDNRQRVVAISCG
ncbi:hypothetical protein DDE23_08060 [Pararhodobacter aggregans]|uniref:Peptidase inhibitor I78 n=1 Tax=Pararhodobacter aggregans TaxID=404875 RepID=A0A2T7UU28_9RHOB|nr:peptidase inhibitor I78 family protein [Pararhodobacter aggregans]PVE48081.1 hypothetical protein DDE23_08060 [Pararhodobacter aggregans]